MDFETLRLFQDVATRLSFAAVAEERGLNPSSVSRSIGQLEKTLGARLFHRTTRRMTLTEAGSGFLQRVGRILEEIDEATDDIRAREAGPTGRLRLSASMAFGERVLVPRLVDFRRLYPNLKIDLLLSDANLDLVAEGVDLSIRLGPRLRGDMVVSRLFDTRYRVCASPDYLRAAPPLETPAQLVAHRCLVFTMPAFRSDWIFRDAVGREEVVAVDGDLAISSALSLRSAALGGAGPALLADWLIRDDLRDGRLVDVFPDHDVTATTFDTAAWLVYPSRAHLPQKVRVMIDFLQQQLKRSNRPAGRQAAMPVRGSARWRRRQSRCRR